MIRARAGGVLIVAVLIAAPATASSSAKDPKNMILQKSDLPAGAHKLPFSISKAALLTIPQVGTVRHAEALYRVGITKYIGSVAFAFSAALPAGKAFKYVRRHQSNRFTKLHVSRLGDEQLTLGLFSHGLSSVVLVVRDGSVVWELAVTNASTSSRTRATADAMALARKQKARVERG